MTAETAIFTCSICSDPSSQICVYCTKDVCKNHRCERCKRCSDCCGCDVPLSAAEPEAPAVEATAPIEPDLPAAQSIAAGEPPFAPEQASTPGFGEETLP